MTIGWSIVGAGHFADRAMAPALNKAAHTRLVAVCSRNLEKARDFCTKHGAQRAYESYEKMLKDPDIDVVYIATPNHLHASQTIQAAEAGRHVLCEKPMALTVADAERMVETCDKNRVKLGVCFHNRYIPAHVEARRYITSGMMGEITLAKCQFCRGLSRGFWQGWKADPALAGSGALSGQGVHAIDLLRYLLDSEVKEVRALTDEAPPHRLVEDMVYVILRFDNGVDGVVISGVLAPRSEDAVELYGSGAKLICRGTFIPTGNSLGELCVKGDSINVNMDFPREEPLRARLGLVVEAFNQSIEEDTEGCISGYNGLQMVKIATAVIESSRQGNAVKIR